MEFGAPLTIAEINAALDTEALGARFSPILTPVQCADLLRVGVSTLYHWLEHGSLRSAHRRRGKRQFVWRDRAIQLAIYDSSQARGWPRGHGIGLTPAEINAAFVGRYGDRFGPILTAQELAELLGLNRSTVYFWIQQGFFSGDVNKRKKPRRFWRNRAIEILFNGPDWENGEQQ